MATATRSSGGTIRFELLAAHFDHVAFDMLAENQLVQTHVQSFWLEPERADR
jgi:hypothetical protein